MTQEHKLVSDALAEIDRIKTLPVADMLDKCLNMNNAINTAVDRIEFSMDSMEATVADGDAQIYFGVFKPNSIQENISEIEEILLALFNWARLHDLEIETDIDITKTIKEY